MLGQRIRAFGLRQRFSAIILKLRFWMIAMGVQAARVQKEEEEEGEEVWSFGPPIGGGTSTLR